MISRSAAMQAIFSKLSEKNKDIVLLVAKSVKVAQDADEKQCKLPENHSKPCKPTENDSN